MWESAPGIGWRDILISSFEVLYCCCSVRQTAEKIRFYVDTDVSKLFLFQKYTDIGYLYTKLYPYLCWNLEAFTLRGGGWVRQEEEINFLSLPFVFVTRCLCSCYFCLVLKKLFTLFKISKRKFEWFSNRLPWSLVINSLFLLALALLIAFKYFFTGGT